MCADMQGVSSAGTVQCMSVEGAAGGYVMNVLTAGSSMTQVHVPQIPCDENEKVRDLAELWGLGLVAVLGVFLLKEFVVRHVMPQ
jgi:hypothetical protein